MKVATVGVHVLDTHVIGVESIPNGSDGQLVETIRMSAAGTAGGTGPDLDQSLRGKDEAYIEESIVRPDAEIARGFAPGIMPPNYGDTLTPAEVDALVKFLSEATK